MNSNRYSHSCFFCENRRKATFNCFDCNLILCKDCKNTIHSKILGSEKHTIRKIKHVQCNIKRRGWMSQIVFLSCCRNVSTPDSTILKSTCDSFKGPHSIEAKDGTFMDRMIHDDKNIISKPHLKYQTARQSFDKARIRTDDQQCPKLKLTNCYKTNVPVVSRIVYCNDGSLWITRATCNTLQKVAVKRSHLQTIVKFDIKAFDIAHFNNGDILIASTGSNLKMIRCGDDEIISSPYDVSPFLPTAINVTQQCKILIGVMCVGRAFPVSGKRKLICIDVIGHQEFCIPYDKQNTRLFSYINNIVSQNTGDIIVLDRLSSDCKGRIMVFDQNGLLVNVYNGHPVFNIDRKFKPKGVTVTDSGSIIVCEAHNHTLHILNSKGFLAKYCNSRDILGIRFPQSLNCDLKEHLLVGTSRSKGSKEKSAIFILKLV